MQIAHIAPTDAYRGETLHKQRIHMAIADRVIEDLEYAEFFRHAEGWVMLDVPTAENKTNKPYPIELLIKAIRRIRPDEVILPDIFGGSMEANLVSQFAAARVLSDIRKETPQQSLGFMAVPWGHNYAEYLECAQSLAELPGVETLGIGELTMEFIGEPRTKVVQALAKMFPMLHLHLLGGLDDLSDILDPAVRKLARSMDTCKFVRWGLEHQRPTLNYIHPYPGRGPGFFDRIVDDTSMSCISDNVCYWNAICEGK